MNFTMKKNLEIIGYSGHSYVCIETAIRSGFEVIGYYDLERKSHNPYNINYLGSERLLSTSENLLFIGIGDNFLRQKIYQQLNSSNKFASLIHPSATISDTAIISENVLISASAIVNAQSKIDFGSIINTGAIIEHECHIYSFAHVAPGAVLAGNVKVGERSFIGANATVKQGIVIGNDVIVGAGSVILNDMPNNSVVVGNPGKIIKKNI